MSLCAKGPGVFIPVVGPSGAGKDSIIAYARKRLIGRSDILFARRVVTRPCNPAAEAHDTVDELAFRNAEAAGAFALSWHSHGLFYGIPVSVDEMVHAGGVVVANLSRASIACAQRRYTHVVPVLVTVSDAVMAVRLAKRGREDADQIAARIAHNAGYRTGYRDFGRDCRVIDNSGPLEEAGESFVRLILGQVE